ncbi:MAG: Nif3-like dinuclear metal center hexameric protein [Deltaproteobacteria bacterium]|nr:Nif3-like dinuclear metal center hexameric protein [Deltaproteobacteria bacterium]
MENPPETTAKDVLAVLDSLAPPDLAEEWDNVGLMVGDPSWPVTRILLALDPLETVLEEAADKGCDCVVTHHPLFFKPLKKLDLSQPGARVAALCIQAKTSLFCMHTNLDKAAGGVNAVLAKCLSLAGVCGMGPCGPEDAPGKDGFLGLWGSLPSPMPLAEFASFAGKKLSAGQVRVSGPRDLVVTRAAVCAGSGGSLLEEFFKSPAQVLVSGDLGYVRKIRRAWPGGGNIGVGERKGPLCPFLRAEAGGCVERSNRPSGSAAGYRQRGGGGQKPPQGMRRPHQGPGEQA